MVSSHPNMGRNICDGIFRGEGPLKSRSYGAIHNYIFVYVCVLFFSVLLSFFFVVSVFLSNLYLVCMGLVA